MNLSPHSASNAVTIAAIMLLTVGPVHRSVAQSLAQRSFDLVLEGDDPSEVFTFDLAFDPLMPSVVRFDGVFENLDTSETGVRYRLWWPRADGSGSDGLRDSDFVRLPVAGRLPVHFDQSIGFTPDTFSLIIEGGGPADHFRFVGDFEVEQVPEPSAATFLGIAAMGALSSRLCRKRS